MNNLRPRMIKKRKSKVKNMNGQTCEMHDCLRRHLTFFRWSGIFPVEGLRESTIQGLRFKLKSFYGIYYLATFLGQATLTMLSAIWCFSANNYSASSITNLFFYLTALLHMIAMFELSKKWPKLVKKVANIEHQLRFIRRDTNTKMKCNFVLLVIGIVCLVEHFLSILFYYQLLHHCDMVHKLSSNLFELFSIYNVPYVFQYTTFAPWKMIIFKLMKFQTVIVWGLTDVIPMCTSLYLISYFRDLNAVITENISKGALRWGKYRLYYTRLESLVSLIDEHLKTIVLFSFFNYLYFITVQLFYLLNSDLVKFRYCEDDDVTGAIERVCYYLFSAFFLIVRALTLSMLAANVHIEAKKPLLALYDICKEEENVEVQRFRLQLVYNPVLLTGSFFSLTRSCILKFLSTIITYELVLVQLNKNRKSNLTFLLSPLHGNDINGTNSPLLY